MDVTAGPALTKAPSKAGRLESWTSAALLVAAIWLAGQFVTQGMADHYAAKTPPAAVLWRGDSADALASLAQQRLIARDPDHAALFARKALERWPLDVAALSTLAVAMDQTAQPKRADEVMTLAGRLGWRDGLTQAWLFGHRTLQGRYDEAVLHADALLRRPVSFRPQLLASLAALAHDPRAVAPLVRRLELQPSWRTDFLFGLGQQAGPQDRPSVHAVLLALAKGRTPPTSVELGSYLQKFIDAQDWSGAAAALRELSHAAPPPGEYVFDGDFDHGAGIAPFDWTMSQTAGSTTLIADDPVEARGKALRVEYDGFAASQFARQLLVAPPGEYLLTFKIRQDTREAPRQIGWTILCATDNRVLAKSDGVGAQQGQWIASQVSFSVPAAGCPSQWLQLGAEAGDRRTDMVVWYDDLSVRRR